MAGQRRIDADDDSCVFSFAYRAVEEEAMKLEWDEEKRLWTLERRGLDFADVLKVLEETYIVQPDDREAVSRSAVLDLRFPVRTFDNVCLDADQRRNAYNFDEKMQ